MPHVREIDSRLDKVYLIGICGTAMASLAGMLKERGFEVTGSDGLDSICRCRHGRFVVDVKQTEARPKAKAEKAKAA